MLKKLSRVISISVISAMMATMAGFWIFEMDWPFLPFPILAGLSMSLIQKETVSYKFLDKLIIGCLLFGFLAQFLIFSRMYIWSYLFYGGDFPFWPTYNPGEYLTFSLIFSFVSFLGGLAGIVLKGFYLINKK
ncbi:hypothetical protein COV49_01100 [Candidatus Falkowbacteria bacterium CG11_big_fil_rev_8_21_14_0_20_39_10]|uniref:Energy-coupling factor transport system substrate-specific component n=1 Tax=Candidatus Falkowbacteria bacterium CG11_big_fil_rev_8_21_14_0_20_39_10 TaxID=1974570 RepID=A0A2M6K9Z1_9BACT|nr:MAG: hypothetical protein COV49_01100 [Candidatus Falkowbacteria bacterium CG11_big_fil_rev_8_21_14_0_20_39_10]